MFTIVNPNAEVRETHDVSLLLREAGAGNAGVLLFSDLADFDRFVAEVVRIHSQISLSPAYLQLRPPDSDSWPPSPPTAAFIAYTDGASRCNPGPAACAYVISGSRIRGEITHKQYLGPRSRTTWRNTKACSWR